VAPPLFDHPRLEASLGYDLQALHEVAEAFIRIQPARLRRLRAAVRERDFAEVRRMAHQLVGSFRSMEMPSLALAAERLEQAAEHRDVLIAAASLRQVRRLFVATLQALNQRLQEERS
jgi:HPt (histidine-containing phosphotransfer) domain-containing protein